MICQLSGKDGNAFAVIGRVSKALRSGGATKEAIDAYMKDATSGDYDHLLQASMKALEAAGIEWV